MRISILTPTIAKAVTAKPNLNGTESLNETQMKFCALDQHLTKPHHDGYYYVDPKHHSKREWEQPWS